MQGMCKELIAQGDHLFSKRSSLLSLWQETAEHFYPERAQFTRDLSLGDEFASHLMTSYPVMARRDLGNSFASMLRQGEWFQMAAAREEREDQAAKEWLEWAAQSMRRAMYARPARFTRATKEGDHDFATFGQCALSVEMNADNTDLLYRCWHLRDLAWAENSEGEIDTFHLKWKPVAKDLARMFPGKVHERVVECAGKEPFKEINCRRIIVPSDGYESKIGKEWKTPYVSIIVDVENDQLLEEVGIWSKVFVVPRWQTVSGSQYAYSPATIVALPDARLIQQMTLVLLEAGEKAVNPPLIGYSEALRSDVATYAGGITYVDMAYDERSGEPLRPLYNDKYGIPTGMNMRDDIRLMIQEAFYLNKLSLPPQGDMTAYEVSQRVQEYIRQALPIFEPLEQEYNGALCEETFNVLMRAGLFNAREMPDALSGEEVQFRFRSPIQGARDSDRVGQFQQTAELLAAAAQMDQSSIANLDVRTMFREAVTATGAPADWLNTETEVEQAVAAMQQAQQQQAMMQQMQQGAEVATQAGQAMQALEGA